jgi:hypothetical protein
MEVTSAKRDSVNFVDFIEIVFTAYRYIKHLHGCE